MHTLSLFERSLDMCVVILVLELWTWQDSSSGVYVCMCSDASLYDDVLFTCVGFQGQW